LERHLKPIFGGRIEPITIISGRAKGADRLGERFAQEHNIPTQLFPADWNTHGRKAGFIRNLKMAKAADILIAFWDGQSRGTQHMIEAMQKLEKPVFLVVVNSAD